MPQTVDIPNVGTVEFPDTMPPETLHAEATKLATGGQQVFTPTMQNPQVGLTQLSSPLAQAAPQAQPSMLGQLASQFTPTAMMDTAGRGLTAVLNSPTTLANQFQPPNQQYAMPFQPQQSIVSGLIPQEVKDATQQALAGPGFAAGLGQAGLNAANQFTSPTGLSVLPATSEGLVGELVANIVKSIFAGQMGANGVEAAGQGVKDVQNPNKTKADVGRDVGNAAIGLGAGGLAMLPHSEPGLQKPEQVARETTGTQYRGLLPQQSTAPRFQVGGQGVVDLNQPANQVSDLSGRDVSAAQQPLNPGGSQQSLSPDLQAQSKLNNSREAFLAMNKGKLPGQPTTTKEVSVNEEENGQKEKVLSSQNQGASVDQPTRKLPSSDVPQYSKEYSDQEKAQGRGGFVLETPAALVDRKVSGFSPDARPDAGQLIGRLDNLGKSGKVSPSEVAYFKDNGLEEFLKGKPTVSEVGKWMQENGPKVEVRKFGKKKTPPEHVEFNKLQHEFFDSLTQKERNSLADARQKNNPNDSLSFARDFQGEKKIDALRYLELEKQSEGWKQDNNDTSHWSFVAPKSEKDMQGYTEIAVVKPTIKVGEHSEQGIKFPSSHNFPHNTLAFARGYMETDPTTGKKTWHVVEVQSDWAQQVRDRKQRANEEGVNPGLRPTLQKDADKLNDPLLAHYETLALKASIDHARSLGADAIAVSDAETAMMSEGHDRLTTDNFTRDIMQGKISQELGMRLHYDRTLPSILERLTGKKGEVVEFGEHAKAYPTDIERNTHAQFNTRLPDGPRKDLIFKDPKTGQPKTSITARSFPLDAISSRNQPFTVFGKRYASDLAESAARDNKQTKALGIKSGITANDLASNIATSKSYTPQQRALAEFLQDNFEHVLRMVDVKENNERGPHYDPETGINLNLNHDYNTSLVDLSLHELVHAATDQALRFPSTVKQRAAVETLNGLQTRAQSALPKHLSTFVDKTFRPLYEKVVADQASILDMWKALDDNNISQGWMPRLYAMTSNGEMLAQMFGDKSVFDWLNEPGGQRSFALKLWDGMKSLLGVSPGSVVDHALDAMQELGTDRERGVADPLEWTPTARLMDSVEGKILPAPAKQSGGSGNDVGPGQSKRDWIEANLSALAGRSVPFTMHASKEVGNKLVRYASSRIAAPQVGEAMASGVLGAEHFKDEAFNNDLGKVLVQDRLNALRDMHERNNQPELAAKVSDIITPDEFAKLKAKPGIAEAIEKHKATVQVDLERMHRFLGGKMSVPGQDTGAFVNLIALLNPDDVEQANGFIYGSRKGDITNPLRKGSALNQRAAGSAAAYDTSYKNMITRAYRANYEEYAKQQLYQAYTKAGLGVEEKPGIKPPTFGGQVAVKVPIDRRGGKVSNLWVRRDLAPELRQALQTDSPVDKSGAMHLADLATELQVMGPTDFVFHMGNMLAALKWSQGGSRTALGDAARKLPFVSFADTAGRLGKAMRDVWQSDPDTQKELARVAMIGAGRAEARSEGLVSKGLQKVGVAEDTARKFDPNNYQAQLIKFMDKSGRLAANRMFDTLVERGWAEPTEENRREFINRMGQYNERLMTKTQQNARDYGFSPFVTAGRTFNRLALQRLIQSPGFSARNPEIAAKARLVETLGTASVLFALPVAWNLAMTGKPFGNPGIPNMGALDLNTKDKDGKEMYFDLLQGNLERRALRITGLQQMDTDLKRGDSVGKTSLDMGKAVVEGVLNPWEGPAVRSAKIAGTGKDMSGFLVSRNPDNTGENLKAALMNLNPTIATLFGGQDGDKGLGKTVSRLGQVLGVKSGTQPTFEERGDAKANELYGKKYTQLSLGERANVGRVLGQNEPPRNELAERSAGERAYWSGVQRKDDLVAAIPDDVGKFIKDNKLKLPGFEETMTVDKERIPLTNSERKRFESIVAQKYEQQTRRFMANPEFSSRTQAMKQAAFDKGMTMARKQAWADLRKQRSP